MRRFGMVTITLAVAALVACGQAADNKAGNATAPTDNGTTTKGNAAATKTNKTSAWDEKGPVAQPEDSALPEGCQTVVKETQACIDALKGTDMGPNREGTMRAQLRSYRSAWGSAADDTIRTRLCTRDIEQVREQRQKYSC